MTQSLPRCPACGSDKVALLATRTGQGYLCESCGHHLPVGPPLTTVVWPAGLAPEDLPTFLAAPLDKWLEPDLMMQGVKAPRCSSPEGFRA